LDVWIISLRGRDHRFVKLQITNLKLLLNSWSVGF